MIENPVDFLAEFADAGADWISVHYEACRHLHRTLEAIAQHGMLPAVVINPATPARFTDRNPAHGSPRAGDQR